MLPVAISPFTHCFSCMWCFACVHTGSCVRCCMCFFKCPLFITTGCLKPLFETNVKTVTLYGFRLPLLHLQTLLISLNSWYTSCHMYKSVLIQGWMHALIGSHFGSLEGKFLLIALVIVIITLNAIVRQMSLNVRSLLIRITLINEWLNVIIGSHFVPLQQRFRNRWK
jgi:hypothetical protein